MNDDWTSRIVGVEEEMSIARSIPFSADTSVSGRAMSPSATSTPGNRESSATFAALASLALRTRARTATPRADSLRTSSAPFKPVAPVTRITLEDYGHRKEGFMEPIALFGIQFTMSLVAYGLIAFWYVFPSLSSLRQESYLFPLLWVHAFRIVGGTILAHGAVDAGVPMEVRVLI